MELLAKKIVEIGSKVKFRMGKEIKNLTIVESGKGNPQLGTISYEAPIAKKLLGAEIGEIRIYEKQNGEKIELEILEIE